MYKAVFLRHGQSTWNRDNRFTGWTDVPLTSDGQEQARLAGQILKENGFQFDIAFTSVLDRAIHTTKIVLAEMGTPHIPIKKTWRLNERHYGDLQGKYKKELSKELGEEIVHKWRRGYKDKPSAMKEDDPRYAGNDTKYKELKKSEIPLSESLEDVMKRTLPYWNGEIVPKIKERKRVFISGHGTDLRGFVMHFNKLNEKEVEDLNIPYAIPLVYEFNENLEPTGSYYLGDDTHIKEQTAIVHKEAKLQ